VSGILRLAPREQRQYFEETGNKLGLPPSSIEKDFWVCWTLRRLFELKGWGQHLTFKGGTSLSKGWKLIQRFSEDIDIVIDRSFLGFEGAKSPEMAGTRTGCQRRLKRLKHACEDQIMNSLKPSMEEACRTAIPETMQWELTADSNDPDGQTLLLRYPGLFASGTGYLQPQIKIELGARSDTEPTEVITIVPYVAEVFQDWRSSSEFTLRAVAPERTFWEKAMLLHEETFRPADKPRKGRLARHYYDLACLIEKGVADKAVKATGLFERISLHRQIYFGQAWVDYGTLKQGTLRLSPGQSDMAYWADDYAKMAREMFFGTPPRFENILNTVGEFERMFNKAPF